MTRQVVLIKPIKNHNGYFASTDGNIYTQWVNKGIHGLVMEDTLRQMRCSRANKHGHLGVRLGGRSGKWYLVHRLIYRTFNGEIKGGLFVRHLNDIPDDNRLENLSLGTQIDNMRDAISLGSFAMGEKNGHSKLTEKDVLYIRSLTDKKTHKQIAKKLGVTRKTVGNVINRKTWKHVK